MRWLYILLTFNIFPFDWCSSPKQFTIEKGTNGQMTQQRPNSGILVSGCELMTFWSKLYLNVAYIWNENICFERLSERSFWLIRSSGKGRRPRFSILCRGVSHNDFNTFCHSHCNNSKLTKEPEIEKLVAVMEAMNKWMNGSNNVIFGPIIDRGRSQGILCLWVLFRGKTNQNYINSIIFFASTCCCFFKVYNVLGP